MAALPLQFSLSFNTASLIEWLFTKGIDSEDCEKVKRCKFRGISFVNIETDEHFSEMGIPLGTRLHLRALVEEAKAAVTSGNTVPARQPVQPVIPATQSQGSIDDSLSVSNLSQELNSLYSGRGLRYIANFKCPPARWTKSQEITHESICTYRYDEQRMALFGYIEKNSRKLGITWATICDALEHFEGNLTLEIRKKYCSEAIDEFFWRHPKLQHTDCRTRTLTS